MTAAGDYSIRIVRASTATSAAHVAALMLELLGSTSISDPILVQPGAFVSTGADLTKSVAACQDTDGAVFRASGWQYRCASVCADGIRDDCVDAAVGERCFWETTLNLDQRDIEAGWIFSHSGFARGNFNYRIEAVGLNFVSSSLRDCSTSPLPNTCFAAGFVPYSIRHLGPYRVRNHSGADVEVKLFTGSIEHARGLAAERYLTNPLSSTDRELLTPYLREELKGRPLDGTFMLRIWDEGVSFDALQDVQLYLKYRYWTRFE